MPTVRLPRHSRDTMSLVRTRTKATLRNSQGSHIWMSYARSGARSQSAPDTDWMPSVQGRSNRFSYRPRDNAHRSSPVTTTKALQQVSLTRP
eukprot:scaffold579_cov169-Pinguiococcus_pyrenoidosus.AAC.2